MMSYDLCSVRTGPYCMEIISDREREREKRDLKQEETCMECNSRHRRKEHPTEKGNSGAHVTTSVFPSSTFLLFCSPILLSFRPHQHSVTE